MIENLVNNSQNVGSAFGVVLSRIGRQRPWSWLRIGLNKYKDNFQYRTVIMSAEKLHNLFVVGRIRSGLVSQLDEMVQLIQKFFTGGMDL